MVDIRALTPALIRQGRPQPVVQPLFTPRPVALALMSTPIPTNSLTDVARKLEDQGLTLTPHRNLLYGVAGVRHPASHGPDKTTGLPWTVTPRGSLIGQLLALVALRSVYLWVSGRKQEI